MRYYLIAGEASGDLHGANLVRALSAKDPDAVFRGFGGDAMHEAGVDIVTHYKETAYMGFVEVFMHLRKILNNIKSCKQDITGWKPDVVILIDYPGFNLRIAPHVHEIGIKVFYYISPQLWAWKSSRVNIIKQYVDRLFVILPFEEAFYQKFNYPVSFVGHPLLDAIASNKGNEHFREQFQLGDKQLIAVLPGSRKQEITVKLPVMLSMAKYYPEFVFVVACAPGMDDSFYAGFEKRENIIYISGSTYDILRNAYAAMVTSGTATLETALFRVPQVVCYKGSVISYHIAKRLVKIKYISLVNLIADKQVVPELIQHDFNHDSLRTHLDLLLKDAAYRNTMLSEYDKLYTVLGGVGASARTADEMMKLLAEGK
ncbi:MAG TPA: lipid-A-disaccharide synthase [Chitinophagales bacterium]|nr:lipid-A-disaccharide synthase [Chitinophagales bacterium]HMU69350.1 lipid-A-disaccharide synthase [Chitinophagales bacterium]HMX03236.1 lipid-A-disaccharide synthase [Chitinophagales bacterium]HMZ88413.1 lipid-A-disaccharide synthase [Chitinophagales bacterium]HNA56679.1 lipid-A-disaccharide synthase [Chitinophagales bacterium]